MSFVGAQILIFWLNCGLQECALVCPAFYHRCLWILLPACENFALCQGRDMSSWCTLTWGCLKKCSAQTCRGLLPFPHFSQLKLFRSIPLKQACWGSISWIEILSPEAKAMQSFHSRQVNQTNRVACSEKVCPGPFGRRSSTSSIAASREKCSECSACDSAVWVKCEVSKQVLSSRPESKTQRRSCCSSLTESVRI